MWNFHLFILLGLVNSFHYPYFESLTKFTSVKKKVDPIVCNLCKTVFDDCIEMGRSNLTLFEKGQIVRKFAEGMVQVQHELIDGMVDRFLPILNDVCGNTPLSSAEYCYLQRICDKPKSFPKFPFNYNPNHLQLKHKNQEYTKKTPLSTFSSTDDDFGYFVHLTDIHYDPFYVSNTNEDCGYPTCCRSAFGTGNSGKYGSDMCDMPFTTLESSIKFISEINPVPDFLFWTGDSSPHDVWNNTLVENIGCISIVNNLLRKYIRKFPIFPCVGNHDAFPSTIFNFYDEWLNDFYYNDWTHFLPSSAMPTVKTGQYYTLLLRPGLRLISLNSELWDLVNFWTYKEPFIDHANQMAWFEKTLSDAKFFGEKVYILCHIPFGHSYFAFEESNKIHVLLNEYSDIIMGIFTGHTHKDHWEVVYSTQNSSQPIGVILINPALTTQEYFFSYTLYKYNRKTGELIDRYVYAGNLTRASNENKVEFELLYSMRDYWNISDLSAASYDSILQSMINDRETFDKYLRTKHGLRRPPPDCDEQCRSDELCRVSSATNDMRNQCSGYDPD